MVEHQDKVDQVLASLQRPMVDQDLAVVLYDMTASSNPKSNSDRSITDCHNAFALTRRSCFMALILYLVMRSRLHASDITLAPKRALENLRRLQHHHVRRKRSAQPPMI